MRIRTKSRRSLAMALTGLGAMLALIDLSVRVDEPQFAFRYSRIAFVLGLGVILCIGGSVAAGVWALFFRASSHR